MKTIILTLLLELLCISNVSANNGIGYGVRAGLNIASQKAREDGENVNTSSLLGVHIGAYGNYFIFEPVAIQVELLFSQKGSKWTDLYFSGKDMLSYIDIPLLIRYQPLEYLNVQAGPQFGILLSAKQTYDNKDKMDLKNFYKGSDIGMVFGVEGNFPHNINITLRYILGLSTVSPDVRYLEGWKNNVLQISIGHRLKSK